VDGRTDVRKGDMRTTLLGRLRSRPKNGTFDKMLYLTAKYTINSDADDMIQTTNHAAGVLMDLNKPTNTQQT